MVEHLLEKDRIAGVVHRLFLGTDDKDWPEVRHCFADRVLFDMTSIAGGEATTLTPSQITDLWAAGLAPIEAIHHQIGNLRIEVGESAASASCYGIAYHFRRTKSGRDTRMFVGSYDFQLARDARSEWRIDSFRFKLKFVDGNLELEKEAGA